MYSPPSTPSARRLGGSEASFHLFGNFLGQVLVWKTKLVSRTARRGDASLSFVNFRSIYLPAILTHKLRVTLDIIIFDIIYERSLLSPAAVPLSSFRLSSLISSRSRVSGGYAVYAGAILVESGGARGPRSRRCPSRRQHCVPSEPRVPRQTCMPASVVRRGGRADISRR